MRFYGLVFFLFLFVSKNVGCMGALPSERRTVTTCLAMKKDAAGKVVRIGRQDPRAFRMFRLRQLDFLLQKRKDVYEAAENVSRTLINLCKAAQGELGDAEALSS